MPYSLSRMACASCNGPGRNGVCGEPPLLRPTGGVSAMRRIPLYGQRLEDFRAALYAPGIVARWRAPGLEGGMEPSSCRPELPISYL